MEELIVTDDQALFTFVTEVLQDAGIDFRHGPADVPPGCITGKITYEAGDETIWVAAKDMTRAKALMKQGGIDL